MGTLVGHVAPGFGFFVIGLWHLVNHIKLQALHPNSYTSLPWFPTSKHRYSELFLIMAGCTMSVAMELFIGPARHQPFDTDGTIPSNHLHNFEHASISMTFFVYAFFSIFLDKIETKTKYSLTQLLACVAFGQQLLVFHLHSSDHMGVEGQYHKLLQIIIVLCLATTLLGINYPQSFEISFVRSLSILFQGLWLMVMGFMLWIPQLIPKGCFLNSEDGHQVVRCHDNEALHRAKALVNIEFSWYIIGVTIFAVTIYLMLLKFYPEKAEYESLTKLIEQEEEFDDIEARKENKYQGSKFFLHVGKSAGPIDMER